jgi:PAS domain S-box-containing protein
VTPPVGPPGRFERLHARQVAGFAAVAIAAAAIVGMGADLPLLSSWGRGLPAMSPVGALCLAALGLHLMQPSRDRGFGLAAGAAVTALAAISLGLALLRAGQGIGLEPSAPPRPQGLELQLLAMPAATAFGLVLAGAALLLSRFERNDLAAAVLASVAGAVALFALLGYATGINALYEVASISSPPLPAVVALLCIAFGLVVRLGAGPVLRRPRPLWHFLAVLGWAIVAPLLLFGAYAGARMADAQINQVRTELVDGARTLSADVDREIVGEIETLQALAASPSLRRGDFAAFQQQAEAPLTLRQSGNIALFDPNGVQIINTSVPYGTPMPRAAVLDQVERALATGKTQVTGLFEGPVARTVLFSIIVPVKIDEEFRYALVRSPSQQAVARVVAATPLPPGRSAAVFDGGHRIIAQSGVAPPPPYPPPLAEEGRPSTSSPQAGEGSRSTPPPLAGEGREGGGAQSPSQRGSGVLEFTDSEGRPSLLAYARSDLTGWGTVFWASKAVLGAPLRTLWRTLGWMALLAFSLVVALALWVGRIIARSVGHAARAAAAIGEGRELPPSGTPVAEVNTLMAELQETADKRQAAEDFLRDSERRLQLALAAAQLGSWQYDPVRGALSGDARAREIFGYGEDEIALPDLMARVHPDDAEDLQAALAELVEHAAPVRPGLEFRLRRGDGAYRWLEVLALVHFEAGDGGRAASVVGTVADVTARKEMEEERKARAETEHLLMREMHHRAKNMLSVVDAIAHQTAARSPEDFVRRFSERIQSLSANQDLLLRHEWKGVEIRGLVDAQLAHFADLIGTRISAEGPALRLNAASSQAIGLALHELATNAGKYGALSTDAGRVDIRWDASGGVFTMSWTESGGPPVSPPQRRGFGTTVMGAMAGRSVGGEVDLDYASAGVRWRLTCPAANALEAGDRLETAA